jgi:hypothetical protein
MSHAIEIIDPEGERRIRRQRQVFVLALICSATLFGYPQAKDFYPKWKALSAARKLGLYLSMLKTRAILNKTPIEARFKQPDIVEVYEVSTCGPMAQASKLYETKLSDFEPNVSFAPEPWVRAEAGSKEPFLPRFCYDPLFGSSVFADGLAHGGIFLVHKKDIDEQRGDHLVQLMVAGPGADLELE